MSDVRREVEPLPASRERANQLRRRLRHEARTLGEGRRRATASARASQVGIVRDLPGVSATTDSVRPDDGRAPDGSIRHILLVAYLYPPCNAVPAHRPAGLRRAFESAGIRTTVLTSEISGAYDDDSSAGDHQSGRPAHPFPFAVPDPRRLPRRSARGSRQASMVGELHRPGPDRGLVVPAGARAAPQVIRSDRPDVIITTSGPESSHLLGLVAAASGFAGSPTTGTVG